MAKTTTWKTKCRQCESPVYYYPAKLLIERKISTAEGEDMGPRIVSCTCTGENGGIKHTEDYIFPKNFHKL
jgi:hypothetical protein